jgi:Big-like domain-containing protein
MTYRRLVFLSVILLVSSTACTPPRIGPTVPSGYFFTLIAPPIVFYAEAAEIIVRVHDAQDNPVDGVAVAFQVDPKWATEAAVTPSRTVTHKGAARTVFRADVIGTVGITAQVEHMTQTASISVRVRGTPRGS